MEIADCLQEATMQLRPGTTGRIQFQVVTVLVTVLITVLNIVLNIISVSIIVIHALGTNCQGRWQRPRTTRWTFTF